MEINGGNSSDAIRQAGLYKVNQSSLEKENLNQINQKNFEKQNVSISDKAKSFHKARIELDKLPDIREDKVSRIMEQIKAGTYNIAGEEIAEKILKNFGV